MKKSVIKRRKRVVPAVQGTQASGIDVANNSMGSPDSDRHSPPTESQSQRGSINPDGSVNLGFRIRNEAGRALLPEPVSTNRAANGQALPSSDLTAYASTNTQQGNTHEPPESLNNDNRLPPMTSYPSPTQRPSSLSPNSFLSPSRKRSFSAAEIEPLHPSLSDSTHPKRLSSIKSILNPGNFSDSETDRDRASPGRYPGVGSPLSSGYATSPANSGAGSALSSARDPASESERSKLERREMLQREAERMREALKAKERELAELGMTE
jgi:GATA-binding protein